MSDKKQPVPARANPAPIKPQSNAGEIDAFIRQAKTLAASATGSGRLILALDATMSRQPTWDLACTLQGQMFDAVGKAGTLSVQLVYFRGLGECRSSAFVSDTNALKQLMTRIECRSGHTQIGKVLTHALKQTAAAKVNALVYIGDAMEEDIDDLAERPAASAFMAFLSSSFRKAMIPARKRRSKRLRGFPRGLGSDLIGGLPRPWQGCFRPSPCLRPAG